MASAESLLRNQGKGWRAQLSIKFYPKHFYNFTYIMEVQDEITEVQEEASPIKLIQKLLLKKYISDWAYPELLLKNNIMDWANLKVITGKKLHSKID